MSTSKLRERDGKRKTTYSYENAQRNVSSHSRPKRRRKQHVFRMEEEAVAEKLVEEAAMAHFEMQCVFLEGGPARVAEAALYFVGQEGLFEQLVSRSQRLT